MENATQTQTATVLTGGNIERFRLAAIESALKLEALGMRHSQNATRIAAAAILNAAGIKPKRSRKNLYEQFKQYRASVEHSIASTSPN